MRRAIMVEPGTIEFQDVPVPGVGVDQVMIAVKRIGVCGSDIHVFHGMHPYTPYPVIQGHEVSGVVHQVGSEVEGIEPGNIVTFTPQVVCGECYHCRTGNYHICDSLKVMGFQTGGAAQDFFVVPAENVVVMPDGFSLDTTAMVEPISVGVHAVKIFGDVTGKSILVLGAGTIGNLVAQVAKALGAAKVMITDISPYKLKKAKACGIEYVYNPQEDDLGEKIIQAFGPDKMDLTLECVGVQATVTQAVQYARKGSTIVIVGVFGEEPRVNLGFVQDRELKILGTLMYQRNDYEEAIRLLERGDINLEPMITHRFSFDDYLAAYHAIEESNGEYMKVMIDLD